MRRKHLLAALLLLVASLQTAWGQGFRVYKSDGTVAQYSLHTDSIVFYDGIGSDEDFGPFTPVNQMIAGTWHISDSESITFNEDGTTDCIAGGTYKFFPYQGTIIIYNTSGEPVKILKVHELTAEQMIVTPEGGIFCVWGRTSAIYQHEWVDLGLPSGTKWATCNVGASKPEEYGDYFAWGEITTKSLYNWGTYFDTDDNGSTFNKYRNNNYGPTELFPQDDAAIANWGNKWIIPSNDQIKELRNSSYTTWEWTQLNGVNGYKVTGNSTGNSIFLPAAGCRWDGELSDAGRYGYYWSSSLYPYGGSDCAYGLRISLGDFRSGMFSRYYGQSVRAVRVKY